MASRRKFPAASAVDLLQSIIRSLPYEIRFRFHISPSAFCIFSVACSGGRPRPNYSHDYPAPPNPSAKSPSPIAPGAVPIKLADGFAFTEGATADNDGNVCLIDQPNDRIMQWTFDASGQDPTADNPHGKVSVFLQPSGRSNGMSFDEAGNLVS